MSRNVPGNLRMNCQKQLTTATQQWLDNGWAIARISGGFPSHASPWSVSSWELNSRIIGRIMTSGFLSQFPSHWMVHTSPLSHHFSCCWCYQQSYLNNIMKDNNLPLMPSMLSHCGGTHLSLGSLTRQIIPLSMLLAVIVTSLLSIFDGRCRWRSITCSLLQTNYSFT